MSEPIHLHITRPQIAKIRRGQPIQVSYNSIGNTNGVKFTNLHPLTRKKLVQAYKAKKGARVHITESELEGTGLLDFAKKAFSFVKKNANVLKPLATAVLDTGAQLVPSLQPAREGVRNLTGVGTRRKAPMRRKAACGKGIIPAGYAGF